MSFHSLLQNLRSALTPSRGRRNHRRRGSLRTTTHWLQVETLEDRRLLTFTYFGAYPTEEVSGISSTANDSVTADFNGDGRLDYFTMYSPEDIYSYGFVYLNRGDGTFELEGSGYAGGYDVGETVYWIGTGDISAPGIPADGLPDLAVLFWPATDVTIYRNNGDWPPIAPVAPSLQIRDVTVTEGNTGTAAATFTVTLSTASEQPITVAYSTANGTATGGNDYQSVTGTLTIPAGQTTGTITIPVNGDRLAEPNETFVVNLSSPTNATIADGQAVGTIVDNEPRISISDVSKAEGRRRQTTLFTFTVTLSAAYDQPVTMSYRTVNGTATTGGSDYVAKTGTLTFAPGETTKSITIEVKGDSKREGNETFYLDLFGNSSNSLFTRNRGLGTILNDD